MNPQPSNSAHDSTSSSDSTRYMLPSTQSLQQPTYPMLTRSKAGISKKKTFVITAEPSLVHEALTIPE